MSGAVISVVFGLERSEKVVADGKARSTKSRNTKSESIFENPATSREPLTDWTFLQIRFNRLTLPGETLACWAFMWEIEHYFRRNTGFEAVVIQTVLS
jgi:hypothetical protein